MMNIPAEIERIFEGKAFERPLFYAYDGGLRFRLSESGSAIEQFLLAMKKAQAICQSVLDPDGAILLCFRRYATENPFAQRAALRALKAAGIEVPADRCVWVEPIVAEHVGDTPAGWLHLAFFVPVSLLQNVLWCALSRDFAQIEPRLDAATYLFDLPREIMLFPYDDRGMDVVGRNHALLAHLYQMYQHDLLAHDRERMQQTFESGA